MADTAIFPLAAADAGYAALAWTGVETSFNPNMRAENVSHVGVSYISVLGVVTALTRGIHFNVALDGSGAVTLTPAALPAAPGTLIVARATPADQQSNFQNLVAFDPSLHTKLHTRAAMRDGELARRIAVTELAIELGTDANVTAAAAASASAAAASAAAAAAAEADVLSLLSTINYSTVIAARLANVPSTFGAISVQGYAAIGDGGAATYRRVGSEPSHGAKLQSADGAWWQLYDQKISIISLGASTAALDNTTVLNDTAAAAVALGIEMVVPPGIWRGIISLPVGLKMRALRAGTATIKRPLASTSNYVGFGNSVSGLQLDGIIFDGDKANNANACNCLVIAGGGDHRITNCTGINAKVVAGGYGAGITIINTTDRADGTRSVFANLKGVDCDAPGVDLTKCSAYDLLRPRGLRCGVGVLVNNFPQPTQVDTNSRNYIEHAVAENCTDSGISIAANLLDSSGNADYTGATIYDTIVNGAYAHDCANFGVAVEGAYINAVNLRGTNNGGTGVLWATYRSVVKGVVASNNTLFGFDTGASDEGEVSGFALSDNPNIGLNAGGSKNALRISGGVITNCGYAIYAERYESGAGAFPWGGQNLDLSNITIIGSGAQTGLYVGGGMTGTARNVRILGLSAGLRWRILSNSFYLTDCFSDGDVRMNVADAAPASTMIISETANFIKVDGTSGITVNKILTQNQSDYEGAISFLTITDPGHDNTTPPILDFTGHTGTGASGSVGLTNTGGFAWLARMPGDGSGKGSGFANNTTFSISAPGTGGGVGPSITAQTGLRVRQSGRRISLFCVVQTNFAHNFDNLVMRAGVTYAAAAGETVEFVCVDGGWVQTTGLQQIIDIDGTLAANSDARLPTQKAVKTYADALIAANDAMVFKGVIDCSGNPNYPAADRGWTYRVSVAGKIGGASGVVVEAGDLLVCLTDGTASGTQAGVGSAWNISQTNLDGAVIGPASVTDDLPAIFDGITGKLIKSKTYAAFKTLLALVKGDVGLGNVDNTADTSKPVSTAQQTALDLKANLASPTFTGTVVVPDASWSLAKMANMATASLIYRRTASAGVPEVNTLAQLKTDLTLVKGDVGLGNVDNTSDATKNAAVATLTNKTLTSPVINTPTGIVKGDVGLGSVDNTSDATKNAASVTLTNKTLTSPVINGGSANNLSALSATSSASFSPQTSVQNTANDAFAAYQLFDKNRAGGPVQVGDTLGSFLFKGWDSGSVSRNACYFSATVTAVGAGSVTADLNLSSIAAGFNSIVVRGTDGVIIHGAALTLKSYTVATVPSASTVGAGGMIYVSNESGGATPAFSDATNWRRVADRAVIS